MPALTIDGSNRALSHLLLIVTETLVQAGVYQRPERVYPAKKAPA